MRFFLASLFLVAAVAAASHRSSNSGFGFVISSLARFQGTDGGFRFTLDESTESTLEATSHALFLSSLYGLKNEIGTAEAIAFIKTLRNADGGFAQQAGKASDVESLREALISYHHVSPNIQPDSQAVAFIASVFDENTGLFRNRAGEPDLRATAMALDALAMLGELPKWDESKQTRIREFLKKHAQKSHFLFPSINLPLVTANYYAIIIGSHLSFDFGNTADWASFIISLQSSSGGVYEDESRTKVTLEATAHATASLRALHLHSDFPFGNTAALVEYLRSSPRDLRSAAFAHLALASFTTLFTDNLKTSLSYEVKDSSAPVVEEIEQGSAITPMLTVTSFNNIAHAGLEIDLEITLPSVGKTVNHKMQWSNETKQYVSESSFDTSNHLGEIHFHYLLRCSVAALGGTFSFEVKDVKRVGYNINVAATAVSASSKPIAVGETIGAGSSFEFVVTLRNKTNEIHSGDFDVVFAVLDSSNVELHSSKTSGQSSVNKAYSFSYTLSDGKVPSGALSFSVAVSNKNGVHTRHVTSYSLGSQLIAADITVDKTNYKIGEKVKVTMSPASYEAKTVHFFSADLGGRRDFVMDVLSKGGVLLQTIKGTPSKSSSGKSVYSFETTVEATLQAIGSNLIAFRYIPKTGVPIALTNYDSKNSELYEDAHDSPLDYVVDADLTVVNINKRPTQKDLHYGAEIVFEFQIRDAVSGKLVYNGADAEVANAFMFLQHKDAAYSQPIVSARQPASIVESAGQKYFLIHWALNANAVTGAGQVILVAQDADGKSLKLSEFGKTTPVSVEIHIGGHIEAAHTHFSSSHSSQHSSVFVVQFQLKCEENLLTDALLRAAVQYRSGSGAYTSIPELSDLIVVSHEGKYQVSWTLPHTEAHSGEYKVQLFREIDKLRALESIEMREQRRRQKEADDRKRAAKGEEKASAESEAEIEIYELKSFLEISLTHVAAGSGISIKMDLFALLVACGATFLITNYKTELVSKTVAKKK